MTRQGRECRERDSQSDLASNAINDNDGNGIQASDNSFIQLGGDPVGPFTNLPTVVAVTRELELAVKVGAL